MSAGPGGIYPVAPDSRHFAVRGGLCWLSNPALEPPTRERLVSALKVARRVVLTTRQGNRAQEAAADEEVEQAKTALGERGPIWWNDGAPDLNPSSRSNRPLCRLVCEPVIGCPPWNTRMQHSGT